MNIFTKHLKIKLKVFINLGTRSSNLRWFTVLPKHYYRVHLIYFIYYYFYYLTIIKNNRNDYSNNIFFEKNLALLDKIKQYIFLYNNNMFNFFTFKYKIKNILFYKKNIYNFYKYKTFSDIYKNMYTFLDFIIWIHCIDIEGLDFLKQKNNIILNSFIAKLIIHKNYCLNNVFYFISDHFDKYLCELLYLYLKGIQSFMCKKKKIWKK